MTSTTGGGVRALKWIVTGLAIIVALAGISAWVYTDNNLDYFATGMKKVRDAGYVEKDADIDGSAIHYAQGPDNGPALLLIHGQGQDWQDYYPVLPELAQQFHVFVVDVYGHGKSAHDSAKYTNVAVAKDLTTFIEKVIGEPAIVSGHSSGGLIATWMAANSAPWVRGVVLEDPPLLTTTFPRAKQTWNWVDLATTCHTYLTSGNSDFVGYSFARARLWQFFGDNAKPLIDQGLNYHAQHPTEPIIVAWLPASINEGFRGMPTYDPRFGEAFYTDSWDDGWDQVATMKKIRIPVTYLHAKVTLGADGILQGATSDEEAARIHTLIADSTFRQTATGHSIHGEDPAGFVREVSELASRLPPP
jgi:pimeloyl-ACP methyl ester carboxylesterase